MSLFSNLLLVIVAGFMCKSFGKNARTKMNKHNTNSNMLYIRWRIQRLETTEIYTIWNNNIIIILDKMNISVRTSLIML